MKEYYLIPKELIDSRIEELNKDKEITNNLKSQNPQYVGNLPVVFATLFELQSLSQPKSWKVEGSWENNKFKVTKLL